MAGGPRPRASPGVPTLRAESQSSRPTTGEWRVFARREIKSTQVIVLYGKYNPWHLKRHFGQLVLLYQCVVRFSSLVMRTLLYFAWEKKETPGTFPSPRHPLRV